MCVLGDGGGDSDQGCIAFGTQAILLDSECISAITLLECLPAIEALEHSLHGHLQEVVETMPLLPLQLLQTVIDYYCILHIICNA